MAPCAASLRRRYRRAHSLPTFIATVVHHAAFIPMSLTHEGPYFRQQPIAWTGDTCWREHGDCAGWPTCLIQWPLHDQSHTGQLCITDRRQQAQRARSKAPLRAQPTRRAEGPPRRCRRAHRAAAHHRMHAANMRESVHMQCCSVPPKRPLDVCEVSMSAP